MSHNSSVSGMGEPVQAIRVKNEKRMLQIMVEINILELWVRICKVSVGIHLQARVGEFGFLTGEEKCNDRKHKKIVNIEVLCILERHC